MNRLDSDLQNELAVKDTDNLKIISTPSCIDLIPYEEQKENSNVEEKE